MKYFLILILSMITFNCYSKARDRHAENLETATKICQDLMDSKKITECFVVQKKSQCKKTHKIHEKIGRSIVCGPKEEVKQSLKADNKVTAQAYCQEWIKHYHSDQCVVVEAGKRCPRKTSVDVKFKQAGEGYKVCSDGTRMQGLGFQMHDALKSGVNAIRNISPTVNGYKAYFEWIKSGSSKLSKLHKKTVAKYRSHFKVNLNKVKVALSNNVVNETAMTDCNTIYFPHSEKELFEKIQNGEVEKSQWFLHELVHAEQCAVKNGRNNYAAMWFGNLTQAVFNQVTQNGNINSEQIHSNMPMEKEADARACEILKVVYGEAEHPDC